MLAETDPELREMAEAGSRAPGARSRRKSKQDLQVLLLPKDPNDEKNVVLEIRKGAGGDEASLFAAEVFRMYTRYAEEQGWKVEVTSLSESSVGGLNEVIAIVSGEAVYSRLKYESGVHRVQRVPATETQGRVHTSTITVVVMPEADEVDVQIEAKDIRIDTFCSSGPGGQSVNTTYSAVRITHLPTNTVVSCQDEKSQIKNRAKAMQVLRSRLYQMEMEKQQAAIGAERKSMVGTGDRSEKIRTYNFPQNRVTDHRIGLTLHQLDLVMEGRLQPIMDALTYLLPIGDDALGRRTRSSRLVQAILRDTSRLLSCKALRFWTDGTVSAPRLTAEVLLCACARIATALIFTLMASDELTRACLDSLRPLSE